MSNVRTIKEAIILCRTAKVTSMLWGHRGLGKSSIHRQIADELGIGFIDLRCSQLESSDLRGLPDRVDGRTVYLPPTDMPVGDKTDKEIAAELGEQPEMSEPPTERQLEEMRIYLDKKAKLQPHYQKGILFLDEINRADDPVLQAVFQLILDGKIGQYTLPPGWSVHAAGNYSEGYTVNGFNDPAFLSRFCHMEFHGGEGTLEDWVNFMASKHDQAALEVIEFATQNLNNLDGQLKGELGFSIGPNRRSWEMVVAVETAAKALQTGAEALQMATIGLVGRDMAISFKKYRCPVKPLELLKEGVKAKEKDLAKLTRGQIVGLTWGLISVIKDKITDDKTCNTALDFAEWMLSSGKEPDVIVAFCRQLAGDLAPAISNPALAAKVAQINSQRKNKKGFIDHLVARESLQKLLAGVAWGNA